MRGIPMGPSLRMARSKLTPRRESSCDEHFLYITFDPGRRPGTSTTTARSHPEARTHRGAIARCLSPCSRLNVPLDHLFQGIIIGIFGPPRKVGPPDKANRDFIDVGISTQDNPGRQAGL